MPTPLSREERYLIAYMRTDRAKTAHLTWLVVRIVFAGIFVYGFINEDRGMTFTGVALLVLFDIWASLRQPRHNHTFSSAVAKLEARIEELETV